MKYLLIFSFLLPFFLFCQKNQVDSLGRKQGEWIKYYPNSGVPIYTGKFYNNRPVGVFKYYYERKQRKAIIKHNPFSGVSEARYYHISGEIMSKGIYKNQKKDSTWLKYTNEGKLIEVENYNMGVLHGQKGIYYVTGGASATKPPLHTLFTYKMGKLNGDFIEFFMDGKIKIDGKYVANNKDGLWIENYPNGRLMREEVYKKGKKHGWFKIYNENNKLISKVFYFNNKLLKGKALKKKLKELDEKRLDSNE